jgi:hypothetical protein
MDISQLADADLKALYAQQQLAAPSKPDVTKLSDDELKALYDQHQSVAAPEAKSASWSDLPGNILPSAGRLAGGIVSAAMDPVGTIGNALNVVKGVGEKAVNAVTGNQTPGEHEVYANAVGQMIADRYGSWDKFKNTLISDPIGAAADLSTVLTGGGGLVAKVPALAKAGEVAATVGRTIDPINAAVRATGAAATGVGKVAAASLGTTSGVGTEAIKTAARAGFEGGDAAKAVTQSMRGAVPVEDVVADAKSALQNVKAERQAAYSADIGNLAKDNTVLDFKPIENLWNQAKQAGSFTGKNSGITVSLRESAADTVKQVDKILADWKALPPNDFRTPIGLDALKQKLDDVVRAAPPGSQAQRMATQAYNVVKDQVVKQAPEYAKTMEAYSKASGLIKEIETALSTNAKASVDTQLRKLQSIMRDNASTNYGARVKLAKVLVNNGATHLLQKLAGQALAPLAPRGVARMAAAATDVTVLVGLITQPHLWPALLAAAASQSPRLVGEGALAVGRTARGVSAATKVAAPAARLAFQGGRVPSDQQSR